MNKINIFFDIKYIIDGFFSKKANRGGIFFVSWHVLQILQRNEKFQITLTYPFEYEGTRSLKKIKKHPYFSQFRFVCLALDQRIPQKIKIHRKNKKYVRMFYNYLRLAELKLKEKLYYDMEYFMSAKIYLSPYYAIPKEIIEQEHIKKFYILHDTTPIIFPEYFGDSLDYNRILNSLNKSIYSFCVSQNTKNDFLKYCGDKLDSNKMFVTHIATNQDYVPNYNKEELLQVLKKYKVKHNPNNKYLFSLCSLEPRKNLPFTITCFLKFIKKHNIQDLYFYLGGAVWLSFESDIYQKY